MFNANEVSRKFVAVKDFVMYTLSMLIESGLDMATRFFERNVTFIGKIIGIKIGSYDGFKPEWYHRILDTNPVMMDRYTECVTGVYALQELLDGVVFEKEKTTFAERQMILRDWMRNHRDVANKINAVAPESYCLYSY